MGFLILRKFSKVRAYYYIYATEQTSQNKNFSQTAEIHRNKQVILELVSVQLCKQSIANVSTRHYLVYPRNSKLSPFIHRLLRSGLFYRAANAIVSLSHRKYFAC